MIEELRTATGTETLHSPVAHSVHTEQSVFRLSMGEERHSVVELPAVCLTLRKLRVTRFECRYCWPTLKTRYALVADVGLSVVRFPYLGNILTTSSAIAEKPSDASCYRMFRYFTQDHSRSFEMIPLSRACVSPY